MPLFFNFREERDLAQRLVGKLASQLPAQSLQGDGMGKLSVNRVTRVLEQAYEEAVMHFAKRKPGFLRRSVLINSFKWGLSEKNYPANFIDVATEGLLMELLKTRRS